MYAIFWMEFLSPKVERENSCALQYASLVINNLSTSYGVPVGIWCTHWKVKSEIMCGVLLKCIATLPIFLFIIIEDLWSWNLTLNSVEMDPTYCRLHFLQWTFIDNRRTTCKSLPIKIRFASLDTKKFWR